ncbi:MULTISPECIES: transcription-repair coupling factor [unclassified Roseitalea]|uniref:transcription-repair coupling factor n=1 Tax=unclassified Roseitalea TaxID=2639107 RepID=UPI00273D9B03|nr:MULTISPECIES: transcription-repair coupling factor [unclassified Roseitalea]
MAETLFDVPHVPDDAGAVVLTGVADGMEGFVLAHLARDMARPVIHVARDAPRAADIAQVIGFAAPELDLVSLPAWDCLPYDRVSPGAEVVAQRLDALARIAELAQTGAPAVILTTANALVQRIVPPGSVAAQSLSLRPGQVVAMDALTGRLAGQGFSRVPTVREVGEFAVRGGIVDLFAPGAAEPVRLDFFGDTLETIRGFDPASQRTTTQRKGFVMRPMSEVPLDPASVARFRTRYIERFGAPARDDALYAAIVAGHRFAGMEHWLPLFAEELVTLFDALPGAPVVLENLTRNATAERFEQIDEYYRARLDQLEGKAAGEAAPYKPVPPEALYLAPGELDAALAARTHVQLSPFDQPEGAGAVIALGGRAGRNFAAERAQKDVNVFEIAARHIADSRAEGARAVLAGWSEGSLTRLTQILEEHGLEGFSGIAPDADALAGLPRSVIGTAILNIEHGFAWGDTLVIGEQDILGDRLVRRRRPKRSADVLSDAASLNVDDLVVHVDHGIGRFAGLKTIEAAGAPHDCLEIRYHGDDRLFLPVENIELLSRYGSDAAEAQLDRLGGGAWQARKARLKKRLLEMAGDLIRIAAERQMRTAPELRAPEGLYDEFAARFAYEETDDQLGAIEAVEEDLGKGRPMDRLICGDVGFGKTEIALRAAFLAAMNGVQVAVVVPTTLLARQHYKSFTERFAGLPINIAHASRLAGPKALAAAKKGVADGHVDIVVGTHALLGQGVKFADLGLLIVDEEQHFGVKHKERLKELKSDVHVLTLSATPIPRTLQLALTGVRELSLITTPPVDRLAVRTFVSPFDPLVIRETLLRERYRGGQSFYVVPRISDLADVKAYLDDNVPELKVAVAHGQMAPGELEDIMNAFYEGSYDVLLSTTIVESGLDIPTANTLIVHRADMFGLAQLYQLRGRVGRSKLRAYALFTLPANKPLTATAERRLKVLQSLDTLGAGFQLASHDLDIRGAGNLLGEEQSGHIKEVGFELYQQMLEEAVAELKGEDDADHGEWSPQITVGTPVMIPESYVADLSLRLSLYRRLGGLEDVAEIDAFGAEMIDRFGPLPKEVEHLLKIVYIKALCRRANVEKLDAGPKGAVVQFRNKEFADPAGLVRWIGEQGDLARIRPDQSVVFSRNWPTPDKRLAGGAVLMTRLADLADAQKKAA